MDREKIITLEGYLTPEDWAAQVGVTPSQARRYCKAGRIDGLRKVGGFYLIPAQATKPAELKRGRKPKGAAA